MMNTEEVKAPENAEVPAESSDSQEVEELDNYITEITNKIATKTKLRQENLNCVRPQESFFVKCDSSLKKNTAFVKKLKQFTASQLDSLLKDMSGLNLTKYISEVSAAIVEAKIKMTDVPSAISLCSKLHQIYSDFAQHFFENWQKILCLKSSEKIANPSKMRVDLRFYAELISAGIFSNKIGLPLLGSILTHLISQDKEEHSNLSIILSFCRHCGEEYAGIVSKKILDSAKKHSKTLPNSNLLSSDKQQNLKNLLKDYYQTLCKHLKSEHKELRAAERTKRKMMESKGEFSSIKKEQLELMQSNFEKLSNSTQILSDFLNEPYPELPKEVEVNTEGSNMEIIISTEDPLEGQLDPWGDEETKSFYVDLPDLRQFLPNYAPKEDVVPDEPTVTEETLDLDVDADLDSDDPPSIEVPVSTTPEPPETVEDETSTAATNPDFVVNRQYLDNFLQNLQKCLNKELIDSAAIDFLLNLNIKSNRKKLVKTLFGVQRTRLDLLPLYARFVAIINLVNKDVAADLTVMLKNDFKYHIKKRDQINIETKIKVVRFIGELTKFCLYPKLEALFCLKYLLHNFQHHQIEMTCAFLEVCGQYLYNSTESRLRTNVYLEQMLRLKTATALDSRHAAQIENSYYLVKPPEGMGIHHKIRPPMHMYIHHLLFEELNKSNVDKMIKLMRRLNWEDPDMNAYAVKCLSKAYNVRYHLIRCLADLVSGLSSYQDKVVMKVIDAVFEDIRAGLEIHSPKLAQRRIAMARYLGELYNYRLVESANVLNTLYSIISLGVSMSHDVISEVDPPGSLFRLKLACVLLETCGQYFTSSVSRKRLDYFLVFFQHYYWFKKSDPVFSTENSKDLFPILVEHMYLECIHNVRPKLKLYKSYDKAKEAIESLRKQLYPNLYNIDSGETEGDEAALKTISEVESEKDDTMTEDCTSEAVCDSEDEIKPRNKDEDDEEEDDDEEDEDDDEVGHRADRAMLNEDEEEEEEEDEEREYMQRDCDIQLEQKSAEKTQEDIDFEQEFEKMALISHQERMKETIKPNTKDIPIPMATKTGKKTYEQLQEMDTDKSQDSVPFVLMIRNAKGGKQQFKSFKAPSDSQLAINLKLQEEKIREENEKVKRLTLNITERIEEEDYQEALLQAQRSPAINKIKQVKQQKFKHQKGAPDADLIFN